MTLKIFLFIFQLPAPKDISDEELLKLLEEEDEEEQLSFRIPMSLGDPHAEVDKGQFFYRIVYHMPINIPDLCVCVYTCYYYLSIINQLSQFCHSFICPVAENALNYPPFLITPTLTSSAVHQSSYQLITTFLSYYNVT